MTLRYAVALCAVLLPVSALADDITGTYLAEYSNAVDIIQLVEKSNGSVIGNYEQYIAKPGFTVSHTNYTVSGAARGNTIVLSRSIIFGSQSSSGYFHGNTLTMTGELGNGYQPETYVKTTQRKASYAVELLISKETAARGQFNFTQKIDKEEKSVIKYNANMNRVLNSNVISVSKIKQGYLKQLHEANKIKKAELSTPAQDGYKISSIKYDMSGVLYNLSGINSIVNSIIRKETVSLHKIGDDLVYILNGCKTLQNYNYGNNLAGSLYKESSDVCTTMHSQNKISSIDHAKNRVYYEPTKQLKQRIAKIINVKSMVTIYKAKYNADIRGVLNAK